MSDRSFINVTIYSAPAELEPAIRALLTEYDLNPADDEPLWNAELTDEEMTLNTGDEIADALNALAPDTDAVVYEIYQAGAYEYDGMRLAQDADGTRWITSTGNDGSTVVRTESLKALLELTSDPTTMRAAIEQLIGEDFLARVRATPPPPGA